MKRSMIAAALAVLVAGICQAHTWMCQWTPEGWTFCLGAHWRHGRIEDEPLCGLAFFMDTQAREKPGDYEKVLRAQWIGDALGEPKVDNMQLGSGGFWNALALEQERAIAAGVQAAEPLEMAPTPAVKVTREDRRISVDEKGAIDIPAAACRMSGPTNAVLLMNCVSGGKQLHVCRLNKDQEPVVMTYEVDVPKAGPYALSAQVVTIHSGIGLSLSVNGGGSVEMALPYTVGTWRGTEPVAVELKKGRNTVVLTSKAGNDGLTLKRLTLTPSTGNAG